jgi:hypothetical protein
LPIVTHFSGGFRKKGATMNPTNGTPTIAVQRPTSAMESFSKKRRRLISSGVSDDESVRLVFMANIGDPAGQRRREEDNADDENNPVADQTPKDKGNSHG